MIEDQKIISEVSRWIEAAVIGLDLCPFAESVYRRRQIHTVVSESEQSYEFLLIKAGNFQLNVMLPVIAYNLLQSIDILANASQALAHQVIPKIVANTDRLEQSLAQNPVLITALNSVIGYELGAKIAKAAYQQRRTVLEVALEIIF